MQTNETKIICPSCGSEGNELLSQLLIEDTLLLTYYCPHCKHSWVDSYLLFIMDTLITPGAMTEMG